MLICHLTLGDVPDNSASHSIELAYQLVIALSTLIHVSEDTSSVQGRQVDWATGLQDRRAASLAVKTPLIRGAGYDPSRR